MEMETWANRFILVLIAVWAASLIVLFTMALTADHGPSSLLRQMGLPTGALNDPRTVGIARFLVSADGSVEVRASEHLPVRPLNSAATGRTITLNTRERSRKYQIDAPGAIHVISSGDRPVTYQNPDEQITINIPSGRATTVAVLDSLAQPVNAAAVISLAAGGDNTHIDFDSGRLSGPKAGADLFYDLGFPGFKFSTTSGARIVQWPGEGFPTLADCASTAPDRWETATGWFDPSGKYCVQTSEGRFVLLDIFSLGVDDPLSENYALWKTG